MIGNKAARLPVVVVAALALVHWVCSAIGAAHVASGTAGTSSLAAPASKNPSPRLALPDQVTETRDLILAAARSGRLDELQTVIDHRDLPVQVGAAPGVGPLDHLRAASADGAGREILAILLNLLVNDPVSLPIGRDVENNAVYVWPALAERDLSELTSADDVELYRLMPVAEAKAMIAAGKWTWWRLAISADGTWLSFMRTPR